MNTISALSEDLTKPYYRTSLLSTKQYFRVSTLASALFLASCGNFGACSNKCDPPLTHDSFCGCVDWRPKPTSGGNGGGGNSAPVASCICQYSNGVVGAWFTYQPAMYPATGATINVTAFGCSDLAVCEAVKTDTGGTQYNYLTGRVAIKPSNWSKNENLLNGSTVWTLFGTVAQQHSTADQYRKGFSPIRYTFNHLLRRIANNRFENTPEACRVACADENRFCFKTDAPAEQLAGLVRLRQLLLAKRKIVNAADLRNMFSIPNDPCNRGNTTIQYGTFENKGDACNLTSPAQSGVTATLKIPGVLAGTLRNDAANITAEFPYPETRAQLRFSDKELDSDWGGEIKSVYTDDDSVGFSVGSESCVSIGLR